MVGLLEHLAHLHRDLEEPGGQCSRGQELRRDGSITAQPPCLGSGAFPGWGSPWVGVCSFTVLFPSLFLSSRGSPTSINLLLTTTCIWVCLENMIQDGYQFQIINLEINVKLKRILNHIWMHTNFYITFLYLLLSLTFDIFCVLLEFLNFLWKQAELLWYIY